MRTVRDAKLMARTLETALRGRSIPISHGESLDLVARQFGFHDWNILSAQLKRQEAAETRPIAAPKAWAFLAQHPSEFDHGVTRDRRDGRNVALIRHAVPTSLTRYEDPKAIFGCYTQTVPALPLRGCRVAVAARLLTEAVDHGATIWARVGGAPNNRMLAFDNLKGNASAGWLSGDRDWTQRRIVIDIAPEAETFSFGFFMRGTGVLRVRDFTVDPVDPAIPLTALPIQADTIPYDASCTGPENLDFSEVFATRPPR